MWSWLFAGTAQVPFCELWNWPLRMGLEMFEAKKLWDAEIAKEEERIKEQVRRESEEEQGTAARPWWETNIGK